MIFLPILKRGVLPFVFLLTLVDVPGAMARSPREQHNLNRAWKFTLGDPSGAEVPAFSDDAWNAVNLPHSFSLPYFLSTKFYTGYGWYRRHLTVPADWRGRRQWLEFEGAFQDARVYVNGVQVGRHRGGYTGFSFDITEALVPGDNVIAVRLNNLWDAQLAPRAGDHTFSGGLYRDVHLVVAAPLRVAWCGTFVTTPTLAASNGASSTVEIATEVRNDHGREVACTVITDILDPAGSIVATVSGTLAVPSRSSATLTQTTPAVSAPKLWHPDQPHLYRARTRIVEDGDAVDAYETPFGFRWLRWSATEGFFLNGSHFYLRGANVHQDHAGWGDGVTDAAHRRDVRMVKEAGFNFIRGSHYPKDPAFSRACDELGLLFWSENCFWGIGGAHTEGNWSASAYPIHESDRPAFDRSVLASLEEMIRIHRNHPSVIAWSVSNEAFFSEKEAMPGMRQLLASSVELARRLDPTRPAAVGGAQRPLDGSRIDLLGDVAGYNGDGATQAPFQAPAVASMVSEYGSPVADRPGPYDPAWGNLSSQLTDGRPTQFPWRAGEAIWCMYDHGSFAGMNLARMGIVDFFRLPKRAFYWYRNSYAGVPPPEWPVPGTPARLGLEADRTELPSVNGTEDAHVRVSLLDAEGRRVSNTAPVTLTIESGPGEFPTGRSITFTPPGNGEASDIAIRDGWAAIAFRAYESGVSVLRATSPGLADATLTITSRGEPAFVEGVTPLVRERPYVRFKREVEAVSRSDAALAFNRPTQASSAAPGTASSQGNDGDESTAWQAAPGDAQPWWLVQLEATYRVQEVRIKFPAPGAWRYRIEVSQDGVQYKTVAEPDEPSNTDRQRSAKGDFGSGIGFVRITILDTPSGARAGLSEVSVGGAP